MRRKAEEEKKMSKNVRDGWHVINGIDVFVEDGIVKRGVVNDTTVYPYRWDASLNCWSSCSGLTIAALRAGMNRGTITMK